MKSALFIYETEHVPALEYALKNELAGRQYDVIACGADIEFLLEEKNIPYRSAKAMRTLSPRERLVMAKNIGHDFLQGSDLTFFGHRDISLGKLFTPGLQFFLSHYLYYFDIVITALETGEYGEVFTFQSTQHIPLAGNTLNVIQIRAFEDVTKLVCEKREIPCSILPFAQRSMRTKVFSRSLIFSVKKGIFRLVISCMNALIRFIVPRKKVRILASEMWKNISALIAELPDAELVLVDRLEAFNVGPRMIMRNRMQFMHPADFLRTRERKAAQHLATNFAKQWKEKESANVALQESALRGYSLQPALSAAMARMLEDSARIIMNIDSTWSMLEKLKPDTVVVRAGISAQTHFMVLCEVARLLGIPSLEVLHGIMTMSDSDYSSDPSSEYIAEYGPLVRREFEKYNYAPRSRCVDIGSPRFDVYRSTTFKPAREGIVRLLHVGPAMAASSWNDTYDVVEYFKTGADAFRPVENIHVTIKLRASRQDESFYREAIRRAYGNIPYTVAIFEPLPGLLEETDMVVSCHSTAVLEALLSHRPVVLDATLPIYHHLDHLDFGPHEDAGALVIADTPADLGRIIAELARDNSARNALSKSAEAFMRQEYLFYDGKSSERLAQFIRTLAREKSPKK